MKENTLVAQVVCFLVPWIQDLGRGLKINLINFDEKLYLSQNNDTSEGAISHNVLYRQQSSVLLVTEQIFIQTIIWVITISVQCL